MKILGNGFDGVQPHKPSEHFLRAEKIREHRNKLQILLEANLRVELQAPILTIIDGLIEMSQLHGSLSSQEVIEKKLNKITENQL